jgi:Protein of unknown function (DUF3017)
MKEPDYTGQAGAGTRTGSWAGFAPPPVRPGQPAPLPPTAAPPPPAMTQPLQPRELPLAPVPPWGPGGPVPVTVPQEVLAPGAPLAEAPVTREAGGAAQPARDRSIVGLVPLLAVLACTAFGVYIAWRQGSAGGGYGGVVGGAALLAAAIARLVLPARLAGLLATRKRATDVITLTALGAGLLVAGLVLPR